MATSKKKSAAKSAKSPKAKSKASSSPVKAGDVSAAAETIAKPAAAVRMGSGASTRPPG